MDNNVAHTLIIQLAVAYTLLGAFIFTVVITCLSLLGIVKFANQQQQNRLFSVLLVELVIVAIAFFNDFLNFDPNSVVEQTANTVIESVERNGIVYIHVPTNSNKNQAEMLKTFLRDRSYVALGIDVIGIDKSPNKSQIRYFYLSQQERAMKLKQDINSFGINDIEIIYLKGYEGKAHKEILEVWFGKDQG